MPDPIPSWEDWLRWALCELYKKLGGDCAELWEDPNKRTKQVADQYAVHGPPTFGSTAEKNAFIKLLNDLEAHLALPENSLDAEHMAILTNLIAQLRAGL